jgi:hypothetical protein
MSENLLSVRGVQTYYGQIMALRGVDVDVNRGEIVTDDDDLRRSARARRPDHL